MEEYLAFVDEIGRTIDGYYTYKFDFTYDKEIVWGDFFNICPCSIVPNLIPDINTLSHTINIDLPSQLELAKNNMCFSMQDCIDGIIPLIFSEIVTVNCLQSERDESINARAEIFFDAEFNTPAFLRAHYLYRKKQGESTWAEGLRASYLKTLESAPLFILEVEKQFNK